MGALAQAALNKAKELRAKQGKTAQPKLVSKGKTAAKKESKKAVKKTAKTDVVRRARNTDIPYAKIAKMYDDGKSVSEISDHFDYTNSKSDWPYSYTYGILKSLRKGVEVDGKVIKVQPKRGE